MFRTILYPVDLSDDDAKVTQLVAELARTFDARIITLYVAPSMIQYEIFDLPTASIPQLVGDIVSGAEKVMAEFVQKHFAGFTAEGMVVSGDAAEEIVRQAEARGADLIVMATHGRKGLNRLLFGSVAEKVIKAAPMPVLTVRPQ